MSEPQFLVPLPVLVHIEQHAHPVLPWRWACYLCSCRNEYEENDYSDRSREAAVSAAVQHLADVHGIRPDDREPEPGQHCEDCGEEGHLICTELPDAPAEWMQMIKDVGQLRGERP